MMLVVLRVVVCVHMFMLFHFACLSSHSCHPEENSALLHFKTSLIIDTTFYDDDYYAQTCPHVYPKTSTWKNGTDCCSWMGVTCHSVSGHVIGLDLACSRLEGKIHPNNTLFHLTHLQTLNFAFNNFYGSELPSQFGKLVSLTHLNLSDCQFKGDIPSQISHLSKLQSLDLSSFYHGLMWEETTLKRLLQNTSLREIVLDKTDMSSIGPTTNPLSLIANLSSTLVTLSLIETGIRGSLTNDILCLPNLQHLILSRNELSVHPSELSCTTSLSILELVWCEIQGPISSPFSNLTHLTSLNLAQNQLNGPFPSSLLNLQRLTHLDLSRNELSGQVPNVFDRLTNLQTLSLSYNNFEGKLPSSLFTLTQLSQLDCSFNQFEGSLPKQVAFSNLTQLFLEGNLLNGTIPPSILSLKFLRGLDLSENQFTGHISSEITSYFLEYLHLCNNKLQGNFPESIYHLVNLTSLCLSSNSWSSTVHFSLFSKLQNLEYLSLSGCNSLLLESETSINYTFFNLQALQLFSNNIIGWSKFSGKFPQLEFLELSSNKLEGKVPQWIHDIHSLYHLKLSHNMFTSIGHQFPWYHFEYLDLSFNLMDDDISSFFCNTTSLKVINLSHNRFTGTFPQCLANSSYFMDLDLQMNNLHDTLPDTFKHLDQLETLNLNGNQFKGLLPKSLSNSISLVDLDLGNNQFEDTFPNWLQNLSTLEILVLRGNKLWSHCQFEI
ncbi:hypothetical protein HN873_020986 [Arachis hypogaea]|nr:receptor-like protein 6 [Arachis hypogaea]QHO26608.1 LRR receptor-like serine/threonine-protein kinase [Arachis hypogaea]